MNLEANIEDTRWHGFEALFQRAVTVALGHFDLDPEACEISILACDDDKISVLNAEFRGKPTPTNVLSWPAQDLSADTPGAMPDRPGPDFTGEISLGDIAISYDTCAREVRESRKSLNDHVAHLVVHGTLHLLGYDHISDPDATLMERTEVEILGKMGIDDPYIE